MFDPQGGRLARVQYYVGGSFRLLAPGDFVLCAVTNARIPIGQLRYWNAELQEPYASAEAATQRILALKP